MEENQLTAGLSSVKDGTVPDLCKYEATPLAPKEVEEACLGPRVIGTLGVSSGWHEGGTAWKRSGIKRGTKRRDFVFL